MDELIARLMNQLAHTHEDELDCDSVFEFMDVYAEALGKEEAAEELLPKVREHLEICRCCGEELEALLSVLEADLP